MRRIFTAALPLASMLFLFSCSGSKKLSRSNFVPFTKDLKARLERDNIDLKQVQFYVDQEVILSRNLGDQKLEVSSGVVKLQSGKYINEVIIPAFTPGICDTSSSGDKLQVSFEQGNNDLTFGLGSGYTANQYVLYGTDWRNGTAAVTYDSNRFRARCGSCQDVAAVTLVVRKTAIDKIERKTRVVKGRTISN
jgi:hypothetical protein